MALIAMAVYDTDENGRSEFTLKTLQAIQKTVDLDKHQVILVDNGSCEKTKEILNNFVLWNLDKVRLLSSETNLGTANAINLAWQFRKPGQHCIKMDNDIVVYESGWVDKLEAAIERDPKIGQIGLKRKDLWESPDRTDFYKSTLKMLPHKEGESWIIVEEVNHVIGSCVMHSSDLLDKVGYLYQPTLYGLDDTIMSFRSQKAGFYNCFYSSIDIDHIDPGGTDYQKWKEAEAGRGFAEYKQLVMEYNSGKKSIYYNPFENV